MNLLRNKMKAHPLAASVCIMLFYILITRVLSLLFALLPDGPFFSFLANSTGILFSFALVVLCGYGRVFRQRSLAKTLFVAIPHLLFFGLLFICSIIIKFETPDVQWLPPAEMLLGLLILFSIGFNEECLFRGIITNLFAEKGLQSRKDVFRVVFFPALLFGTTHILNLFSGVALSCVLVQSIGAFAAGCLFGAYYLRGGSLWALILLHALQDASGLFGYLFTSSESITDSLNAISPASLIPSAVMFLIALFLLRKSKCEEIIALRAKDSPAAR